MSQITLSVNDKKINCKLDGQFVTDFSVKQYDLSSPDDIILLEELFQTNCYSNNIWSNPKKDGYTGSCSRTNYIGMTAVVLDFDELIEQTFYDTLEMFGRLNYTYLAHTSASHQVDLPDKGGKIDRFRIILPFEPKDGYYYPEKLSAERFYAFIKSKYPESDPSVQECARKFYPFCGPDSSKYQFEYRIGKYISFNEDEISVPVASASAEKKTHTKASDYTKENVTTGEAYFSPTKQEYLMPDEVVKAKINNVWVEQPFQDIKEAILISTQQKVQCYCNHCNDRESQTPSAFLYKDFKGFFHLECTHCKNKGEKQFSWREYPITNAIFCQNDNLYEIKVKSAEHVGPHKVGKERFFSPKEASFAYQHIKNNRYFMLNCSINYLSDPNLEDGIPKYELCFEKDEINIKYPLAKIDIQDNEFIDNYIDRIFGEYSEFIKNWLALYTYTNYETLPVLVLVGNRATGKNTFVQMVGDILPQLWAQWSGDHLSFNEYHTKKLLWVDENAFGDKRSQYDEIKFLTGNKYVTVNEKYQPKYRVKNNIKVILTTNDFKPLAVKNEEIPTSEKDNNFFFYQFPPLTSLDRTMGMKLKARIGYYCRTELKRRYQEIINNGDESCRYFIPCPITAFSKEIYVSAKTDLDLATDDLQEFVERWKESHIKYSEINEYLKDRGLLRNGLSVKHYISALQKRKTIGTDIERTKHCTLGYKIFRQENFFDHLDDSFTEATPNE